MSTTALHKIGLEMLNSGWGRPNTCSAKEGVDHLERMTYEGQLQWEHSIFAQTNAFLLKEILREIVIQTVILKNISRSLSKAKAKRKVKSK
jgi:hypothetical protein